MMARCLWWWLYQSTKARTHPLARSLQRGKTASGKVRHVLAGPKKRLDKGIVVTDPRPAETSGDTELAKHDLHGLALDRTAVVTVQHQGTIDTVFFPDRFPDQPAGVHGAFVLVYFPAENLAAEQVAGGKTGRGWRPAVR